MIELNETYHLDGRITAKVDGLYTANATIEDDGPEEGNFLRWTVTTNRGNNGSIRHTKFSDYNKATDYALGYAGRIYQEKRECDRREFEELIDRYETAIFGGTATADEIDELSMQVEEMADEINYKNHRRLHALHTAAEQAGVMA